MEIGKSFFALCRSCTSSVGYSYFSYKKYRNHCGLPRKTSVPGFRTLVCFSYFDFFMRLTAVGQKKMHKCLGRLRSLQKHACLEEVAVHCQLEFAVHQLCQILCYGKAKSASFSVSGSIASGESFHEFVSGDVKLLA